MLQVVKVEGRKTFVEGFVEDGNGTVYASATALFVRPRAELAMFAPKDQGPHFQFVAGVPADKVATTASV